ncbi:hypothetical protein AJ88_28685 [Mesorhizobium amorphae CCBAU 01583]|nr:hypothetical protein AJ88_28685 [Mesorhizobium amorphae CCBAU 01583]
MHGARPRESEMLSQIAPSPESTEIVDGRLEGQCCHRTHARNGHETAARLVVRATRAGREYTGPGGKLVTLRSCSLMLAQCRPPDDQPGRAQPRRQRVSDLDLARRTGSSRGWLMAIDSNPISGASKCDWRFQARCEWNSIGDHIATLTCLDF